MSDYTPTTEEARNAFVQTSVWLPDTFGWAANGEAFDRWLTEHDRQVAERAWDEAIEHVDDILGAEYSAAIRLHQPYRAAKGEQK